MSSKIILAADELDIDRCLNLVSKIGNQVSCIKIHNLYDQFGPRVVRELHEAGAKRVWVDFKLHDIPNTVRLRAEAIASSEADILTVHVDGGVEMMIAARKSGPPQIYGVTVLTSLGEEDIHLFHGQPSKAAVLYRARLAQLAGLDGIVCSPQEVGILSRRSELKRLAFVVPGIRLQGKDRGDQQRVDTPSAAIKAGATYLVIGRPITQAQDPLAALNEFEEEIDRATAEAK